MESCEQARAGLREWTVGVDERALATFHELEMARAPLRRTAHRLLSAAGRVRDPNGPAAGCGGPGTRSRPGKRW